MKRNIWTKQRIYWRSLDRLASGIFILGILAIGCLFACQRIQDATEEVYTPEPDTFKVGMLLPGAISDQGWNALAHDG